jgi:hypothetical protein
MSLRLALIFTVLLASAPVLFTQHGLRPGLRPLTGWITDGGEGAQAESASGRQSSGCVVIGADLFRPGSPVGNAGTGNLPRWNRPSGLPLAGNVACATAQSGGV